MPSHNPTLTRVAETDIWIAECSCGWRSQNILLLAVQAEADRHRTVDDPWVALVTAEIGPLLAGRDLRAGGSFEVACREIADALRSFVK